MKTRQAKVWMICAALLAGPVACSPPTGIAPTQTVIYPSVAPSATLTLTPPPAGPSATPTALACRTQPGELQQGSLPNTIPQQSFIIYLPPCYHEFNSERYPTLYLLHGQTYTDDQWVRLGVPAAADDLIHSGAAVPFIIVFPDDHYWNAPAGATFGKRLIDSLIPFIDANYRTLAERDDRALGGLSRGGGWTVKLGFENPQMFGSLGLHSPAVFAEDAPYISAILRKIPEDSRPRLWFDIGDADKELASGLQLENLFTVYSYVHEFHMFTGDHSETYWHAHVSEYLQWYAEGWAAEPNP